MFPGQQPHANLPNMRLLAPTSAATNGVSGPTYNAPTSSNLPSTTQKIYISGVHDPQPLQHARAWFATGRYLYTGPTEPAVTRSLYPAAGNSLIPSHDPHHPPVWDPSDVRFRVGFVPKYDELNSVKILLKMEAKRGSRVEELTAAHEDARGALSRRALRKGTEPGGVGVGGAASRLLQQRAGRGGYTVVSPMPPQLAPQQLQQNFIPGGQYFTSQMQAQLAGLGYGSAPFQTAPPYQSRSVYPYQFYNHAASFNQSSTSMPMNRQQYPPYNHHHQQQKMQMTQRQLPRPQSMIPSASYNPQAMYAQPRFSHSVQQQAHQFVNGRPQDPRPFIPYQGTRGGVARQANSNYKNNNNNNNSNTGRIHPGAYVPAGMAHIPLQQMYSGFPF